MHSAAKKNAPHQPETTEGAVLRRAHTYDFFTGLIGLGARGALSRRIVESAGIKPGETVLDVGCGPGSLAVAAKTAAGPDGRVHGIDASPEMIAAARQKAASLGRAVQFDVGFMERLAFGDESFDVVLSRLAIHHLPQDLQPKAFAEIFRVLKRGGRALIADMPTASHGPSGHLALVLAALGGRGDQPSHLIKLFQDAGFADVELMPLRSWLLMAVRGKKP